MDYRASLIDVPLATTYPSLFHTEQFLASVC